MKSYNLGVLIVLIFYVIFAQGNPLLQKPQLLTVSDIQQLEQEWNTDFTWNFNDACNFMCSYNKGQSSCILQIFGIPVRSYNFQYWHYVKEWIYAENNYPYMKATPLAFSSCKPNIITLEKLISTLNNKKFVFYTGAGISAQSKVATMKDLEKGLKLDLGIKHFLYELFFNPQSITDAFTQFCHTAIYNLPTPAHYALHEMAQQKEVAIVTENVDLLQQRTGSKPIFTHSDAIESICDADWQEIDYVLCIGLSHDDCGLLAHYKNNNPAGIIIGIDIGMPNYLSEQDFLVQGDAQKILPALACAMPA